MSGLGLFNTRAVSVGDIIELKVPVGPSGAADWRVVSYDSAMLGLRAPARLERSEDGSVSRVFTVAAKTPGQTEVVLQRIGADERKVFRISIFAE